METNVTHDILNRILDDTVNSVVQYAEIGAPYVPKGFDDQMAVLERVSSEEKALAHEIVGLLADRDGVPKVGVFPFWNVDLNYLDIRFMAKFALEQQQKVVARVEKELDAVRHDPEVHGLIRRALDQKREHLEALQTVAGS
ncbi:MAG: ferritin-like domain-containing protein [Planctomycetota bacterium]|jgi:bacterioferritin (cytochrome b1)